MTSAEHPSSGTGPRTEGAALPPTSPARPPLRRSGTDWMAGGVCGGLAEQTGVDALLWRVAFVALTLAGGAGVVLYAALWVLMPPAPVEPGGRPRPLDGLVARLHDRLTAGARR